MYEMNILFIGPYRQSDEYGLNAHDYINCLSKLQNHTLSSVPIYMAHNIDNNVSQEILNIENTYCDKFDVIIQNVLPNYFERHDGYNIGIYYSETKNLNRSFFINKINLLNELWVSSDSEKYHLTKSGVTIKISVIPIPLDTESLDQYVDVDPLEIPGIQSTFNFYMLADYIERKNIEAAVIAFNREFSHEKNTVNFIIKTGINGLNNQQSQTEITKDILQMKTKLRLYNQVHLYSNEILITNILNRQQIMSLHKTGNCLLVPSRGEAYCRPALEALYFNNTVICTDKIHTCSILKNNCIRVKSMEVPVMVDRPPAPHIYTGWETWNEISILDLQKQMRLVFNNRRSNNTRDWVKNNFSYQAMSKKIEEQLCQL